MKTKVIACSALALVASISGGSLPARAAKLAPVTLGVTGSGSASNWPIYVALAEGFFKDDGLAVNLVGIPASSAVQQQLAAGSINIGMSAPIDALRAMDEGAPITLFRLTLAKGPYGVFAKPSIHSMAQLRNKTVSIGGTRDITHYYFDRMAAGKGLDPASCNLVYAGASSARLSALVSGSVDAAMLNPPYIFLAQAKGYRQLPVQAGYDKGLPFDGFVVNLNWGQNHKPLIRDFLEAYSKGVAWLYKDEHRKEAVNILLSRVKITPSEAEETYEMYVKGKFFVRKETIENSDLQDEIDLLKKDGSLTGSTDFSRFYKPALLGLSK